MYTRSEWHDVVMWQAREHAAANNGNLLKFVVDDGYVRDRLLELSKREDLAKYVL